MYVQNFVVHVQFHMHYAKRLKMNQIDLKRKCDSESSAQRSRDPNSGGPKTNGVRLCGDFKVTINPNVIPEHYPLPNAEDIFASLNSGNVFSKIDLTHAYQQLEINEVLFRLVRAGVRVNKQKCLFSQSSVEYLGHRIDEYGIHPTVEKVRAINEAPKPTCVKVLRLYLGLVNYYGKLLPNLSTVLRPLQKLLLKDVPFKWSRECDEAIKLVSGSLLDRRLGHYDSDNVLRLATDALPVVVGAVLSHVIDGEEVPIAFGSRTLSSSEMKYPQIEKETLSIIFGVKNFHKYLYGRKFQVITNHKPLVTILGRKPLYLHWLH